MKTLLTIILILFTISCVETVQPLEITDWGIKIVPRLTETVDGYYVLPIDTTRLQTLHRLSGELRQDGGIPTHREKIGWESSHMWVVGDTLGFIVRRTIDAFGNWSVLDTSYVDWFEGYEVPTINSTSITKDSGEFNVMMAPIHPMRGDTMTIRTYIYKNNEEIDDIIQIILQ